jgi:hypothetical protein
MKKIFLTVAVFFITGIIFTLSAQTVMLDYYFNHEVHTTKKGKVERFHYMWEDTTNNGYSIWGKVFVKNGANLKSLEVAPTVSNLKGSDIYIIVDPDTKKESPNPNYIEEKDINEIAQWVKAGGVLVMMANDSANVELPHFNHLAARFGMHFNDDIQNHVIKDNHDQGAVVIADNPILKTAKKIFIKDACSIGVEKPAVGVLKGTDGGFIIATAKYGKGTVLAVGDPWLYNEYVNGNLSADFENDKACDDVSKWLIKQVPAK